MVSLLLCDCFAGCGFINPSALTFVERPIFMIVGVAMIITYFFLLRNKHFSGEVVDSSDPMEYQPVDFTQRDVLGQIQHVEWSEENSLPFTNFSGGKFILRTLLLLAAVIAIVILKSFAEF